MSEAEDRIGILFVCTGNICRSPTAEGVAIKRVQDRGMAHRFLLDSAGTTDYHVGEPPDMRAAQHAKKRGYDLSSLRARAIRGQDFHDFHYILAMDQGHLRLLNAARPRDAKAMVAMFTSASEHYRGKSVPDPYYGGPKGFEDVLDMIEEATDRLIDAVLSDKAPDVFKLEP